MKEREIIEMLKSYIETEFVGVEERTLEDGSRYIRIILVPKGGRELGFHEIWNLKTHFVRNMVASLYPESTIVQVEMFKGKEDEKTVYLIEIILV